MQMSKYKTLMKRIMHAPNNNAAGEYAMPIHFANWSMSDGQKPKVTATTATTNQKSPCVM